MGSFEPGQPQQVQSLFEQIAPRYDLLNDLLSLGLHRVWKRQAIAWLSPRPGQTLLDLCCGTGDLALVLASRVRPAGRVIGLDAAAAPLQLAARRSARAPWLVLEWRQGDALASGLPDGMAAGVAMAYGLRNLADPAAGLAEVRRLLRPGGRAAVLDFNRPDGAGLQGRLTAGLQKLCLRGLVVPAARLAGLEEHYAYLEPSLARLPTGAEQERLARRLGFRRVHHRPLAAGLMGLLELQA
ncbi:bifunctional demethylmenaquinone methyltransferase/2-methoxy-6-polyprenyl-1,4-benzoquinol methylase UbiE [Cyanobium sp. LEGE 06113]|uniref:bifunctional demethylmenaquinone methyltransferase/2-methoxy-6-polyprenyl-1,4-benzoquinol methylase UbiE n=1 Tax=Cyanobium sp. LEGE 06113 TaxID=1297573 RepID=UPI00187E3908|nr:bifunctional demethylmenaquinone methyltransferase/2-methoxy-6-polyprenyl-1,4-benzoquinol methylase UbiE [Cyanobium sp. LEGE 06113]MBE9152644.1 bifunctional demethylmenaquinone methyltransferase/2-methoxy-6-polyprenyl-1,4-benzoquinol methylase UbiE [Cyanobium sp. LEGE 06113]MBE9153151.1 bifunctional demethylmenaquinone methyltransferase/2-methoxy-6-polyprenyl-1,4-benzoquinol methylase UbiE [Cyanobium sp. LEGE 06113]